MFTGTSGRTRSKRHAAKSLGPAVLVTHAAPLASNDQDSTLHRDSGADTYEGAAVPSVSFSRIDRDSTPMPEQIARLVVSARLPVENLARIGGHPLVK